MGRPPCCDKLNVKRGPWTAEEDAKILAYVSNHGVGNWTLVPKRAGLNRCGKSCRLRWTNYLRPDLKHDGFTPQEEDHIINLHKVFGSRWSFIAKQLPGRTDNDVKNYWNTKLKKKLSKMGIDPVTHKPFSQILSEYGNISGIQHIRASSPTIMSQPEPTCSVLTGLDSSYSKMIRNPVMEQVNDNISISNNPCWDFVTGFHVSNPNNVQSHFFGEATSSCSSPSTTAFSQFTPPQSFSHRPPPEAVHIPLTPSFAWNEFLLSDPASFLDPPLQQQEHTPSGTLLSSNSSTLTPSELSHCFNGVGFGGSGVVDCGAASGNRVNNHADSASSSASSFVDTILDHDRELCSQFPELLDGSFDY